MPNELVREQKVHVASELVREQEVQVASYNSMRQKMKMTLICLYKLQAWQVLDKAKMAKLILLQSPPVPYVTNLYIHYECLIGLFQR